MALCCSTFCLQVLQNKPLDALHSNQHVSGTDWFYWQAMMNLSKEQIDDLQHVRRMYVAKHRLLTFKRQALARLASEEVMGPQHGLTAALELTAAAKDITGQEYEVKYVAGIAVWCGVSASFPCHSLHLSKIMLHDSPCTSVYSTRLGYKISTLCRQSGLFRLKCAVLQQLLRQPVFLSCILACLHGNTVSAECMSCRCCCQR